MCIPRLLIVLNPLKLPVVPVYGEDPHQQDTPGGHEDSMNGWTGLYQKGSTEPEASTIYTGFPFYVATSLAGWFIEDRKSEKKVGDLGLPPFSETYIAQSNDDFGRSEHSKGDPNYMPHHR